MILGVLSDTHGDAQRTATAIRILRRAGARAFIHCGDVGGAGVLDELAGLKAWIVCGNTDCPDARLEAYARSLGLVVVHDAPLRIELAGRALAAFHGHEALFDLLFDPSNDGAPARAQFGPCDYILHGHTHAPRDVRVGPWRVVNPGALQRAIRKTVATIDLRTDTVQFWEVPDEELRKASGE